MTPRGHKTPGRTMPNDGAGRGNGYPYSGGAGAGNGNGNGYTNGHGHGMGTNEGVPARCQLCAFYRLGSLQALRAAPGEAWRCDMVPGHVHDRTVLAAEGAPARQVFAVRSGVGRVYRTLPTGRVVALRLVRPGDLVGTEGLATNEYASSFESLGDLQYCAADAQRVQALAATRADLAREMQMFMAHEMEAYRDRMVSLAVLDRRGRVAELLLDMEKAGVDAEGWAELLLAQQEAAELLGSTQETMSRVLAEMVRRKWIARKGRRFKILDRTAMQRAAAGEMERPAPGRHVVPNEAKQ